MTDETLIRLMAADRRNCIQCGEEYVFKDAYGRKQPLPYEQVRRLVDQWQLEAWRDEMILTDLGYKTAVWLRERAIVRGDAAWLFGLY